MSEGKGDPEAEKELEKIMAATAKKVTEDLNDLGFNTAIAALMECVNDLYKLKAAHTLCQKAAWHKALTTLVQLLAPFAPHISEELWQQLGQKSSVHTSDWPKWDDSLLTSDTVNIVVQVNGKVRANVDVQAGASEEEVAKAALANEKVAGYATKTNVKKTIYVKNRLINFVV